jgi:Na+/melibiose symporter-like transporter
MSGYTNDGALAYRRYLIYVGFTAGPIAMLGALQLNYFTLYATDELLIAPAVVGTIFAIARIYDGVTDLLIGWWSDQREGRSGRRRPLLIISAGSFIVLPLLWLPPISLDGIALIAFFAVALLAFETFSTLYNVPFISMGIEVARTPKKRAFAIVVDRAVGIVGLVGGLALMQFLINSDDARATLPPFILGLAVILFLTTIGFGLALRELPLKQEGDERTPFRLLREMWSIRYYRQFMAVVCAETFCYASIGFGAVYVMQYVVERPELTILIFLTYFVLQYLTPMLWYRLIPRFGLVKVWLYGQYLWFLAFLLFPLVLIFGLPAFWLMAALGGIASAAGICAGRAVLGDIVDYDAHRSKRQRQGIYTTTFLLAGKIVSAAAVFALGWLLELSGYVPGANQNTAVIAAISLSVSALPLIAVTCSILILRRYDFYTTTEKSDGLREALPLDGRPTAVS